MNRPLKSRFSQQELKDWQINCNVNALILLYFIAGIILIPVGVFLRREEYNRINEYIIQYDGLVIFLILD